MLLKSKVIQHTLIEVGLMTFSWKLI